ncbi:MAG TPA: hypothetical protein VN512_02410 [Clostridia bacterium]|nr:hypothetical protein [Clostridia bacterium]
MRLKDRLICIAVALCIAAYLIWMPPYIDRGLKADPYSQWVMPEEEGYTGILTVWHIVGFKPYTGSGGDWLKDRAKEFEKRHTGVYIEVFSMDAEECEARFLRGESADIYSFPLGWGYAEQFLPLDSRFSGLMSGLLETGEQDGVLYAVPFMVSGYTLMTNTRLLQERQVILPEEVTPEWLNVAAAKLTYETGTRKKVKYDGLSGSPVASKLAGAAVPVADYSVFKSQRAGMAVTDLRAAGDLTRLQSTDKGFAFDALPVYNYTDLVQYLGIARGIDERKLAYAYEFLEIALSEKAQATLMSLCVFPVKELPEVSYEPAVVQKVYERMGTPVVPNAFLYQRYKDALLDAANRALNGDEAGNLDFFARVEELVNGRKIK